MIRVAVLLVVLAAGCSSAKPDVWSEYATAQSVWESERRFQNEVELLLKDSPDDPELKSLKSKADSRVDRAAEHLKDARGRVPGMP